MTCPEARKERNGGGEIFDFAFKADALPLAVCGVLFLWADLFQEVQQNLYIHCSCH